MRRIVSLISLVTLSLISLGCANEKISNRMLDNLTSRGYINVEVHEQTVSKLCAESDIYAYNVSALTKNGKPIKLVVCQFHEVTSVHKVENHN